MWLLLLALGIIASVVVAASMGVISVEAVTSLGAIPLSPFLHICTYSFNY